MGKTVVTSSLIDRLATRLGKPLLDMPVGFKHFVDGLATVQLVLLGEESAGESFYARADVPATSEQKTALTNVNAGAVAITELAGDSVQSVLTLAPGNQQPIGGVKIVTNNGWFAVRPSGTEASYKLYAASFKDESHLQQIQTEATAIVQRIFAADTGA